MVAVLLGAAAAVAVCGAVVLSLIAEPPYGLHLFRSPEPVIGLAFSVVGAVLVAGTRVARPMGWLLLAVGACAAAYVTSLSISAFLLGFDGNRLLEAPADGQLSGPIATAVWLTTWTWLPALVLTAVVLPQVVPYGRALTRWWNLLLISSYVVLAAGIVVTALQPGESTAFENVVNPYGIPCARRCAYHRWALDRRTAAPGTGHAGAAVRPRGRHATPADRPVRTCGGRRDRCDPPRPLVAAGGGDGTDPDQLLRSLRCAIGSTNST